MREGGLLRQFYCGEIGMKEMELKNISKSIVYGFCKRKQVIEDLSLSVDKGTVFGFIGPNGAGKSTLINLLMGFTRTDRGSITIRGMAPTNVNCRKIIGYLPENARYQEQLTPEELLRFGGRVSGMSNNAITEATTRLLAKVDLLSEKKKRLSTFSKGMKQRMGIALSMVQEPEIFVLDEPMSGLDPLGRNLVKKLILAEKERKRTIFFSSHILNDVETLCDQIAVIDKGHILYSGSVDDFVLGYEDVESAFIALIKNNNDQN